MPDRALALAGLRAGAEASWRPALAGILALGLALRICWALVVPVDPVSDSYAYHVFAGNIAEHGVFGWTPERPTAYWPVGAAAIVAGLYVLFGESFTAVVVLNITVSVLVILQVFLLARRYFDVTAGLLAAAIIAFWPSLILYVTIIASEVFFIFFILGGLLAFEARWRRPWVGWLVAGLFWAAACYVRPLALLLPPIVGFAALVRQTMTLRESAMAVLACLLVMGLAIAPWTYRNHTLFGTPVLISTNFGPTFWMGNHPGTTGGYTHLPEWAKGVSETERAARLSAAAWDYVREEPAAFLWRTAKKFAMLHNRETIAIAWNEPGIVGKFGPVGATVLKIVATGYWYAVLLLGAAGIVLLAMRGGLLLAVLHPLFLCWMYFALVHAVVITNDRYHFPSIPFIAVLATLPLAAMAGQAGPARSRQVETT